jgi:hypothetical protein
LTRFPVMKMGSWEAATSSMRRYSLALASVALNVDISTLFQLMWLWYAITYDLSMVEAEFETQALATGGRVAGDEGLDHHTLLRFVALWRVDADENLFYYQGFPLLPQMHRSRIYQLVHLVQIQAVTEDRHLLRPEQPM